MKQRLLASPSRTLLFLFVGLLLALRISYFQKNERGVDSLITWDDAGYYAYLPATFIYNDIEHLAFMDSMNVKYPMAPMLYMIHKSPIDKIYIMYPSGVAIMTSPWFFMGHAGAKIFGYPADGYSYPYKFCIAFGMLFYVFVALFVVRKILLLFFSEWATTITLAVLVLGTNFLLFGAWYNTGAHLPNFLLFSLIIYSTIRWHIKPSLKHALIIGGASALAVLIRPTDGLIVLFPLLYGIKSKESLGQKFTLVKSNFVHLLAMGLIGLAIGSIQLFYWKKVTGNFLFFSYPGEWFDFLQPHLASVFFGYDKGWLLYSPILIFAWVFLVIQLWKKKTEYSLAVGVIVIISSYIIASWSNWWYGGGGFGHRAFLELYPLLALPLCYGVEYLGTGSCRKYMLGGFSVLILFSLFQHWQWSKDIQGVLNSTRASYWQAFLKTDWDDVDKELRYREFPTEELAALDPDQFDKRVIATVHLLTKVDSTFEGFRFKKDKIFSPAFSDRLKNIGIPKHGGWMMIRGKIRAADTTQLKEIQMVADFRDRTQKTPYYYTVEPLKFFGTPQSDTVVDFEVRLSFPKHRFNNDNLLMYVCNMKSADIDVELLEYQVTLMERRGK